MLDQPSKSYDEMLIHSFEEQLYFALVKRGRSDDVAYFHIQKNKASLTEIKRDLRSQAIELYWPNSAPDITNFEFENKEFTSVKLIRHKCPRGTLFLRFILLPRDSFDSIDF